MNLILHTSGDISAVGTPLRATVAGLNPNVPVGEIRTMESIIASSVSIPNSTTRLFSVFSALALFLGAVGIYSVISFSVVERRREIGIRIAIGATSMDVLKLVIGKGMTLTIIGIVVGTAAALGLTRLLSTLLFGVKPFDLIIFVMVPIILAAIAFLASYIPARRATKIDPTTALKFE
jgi:putative ABC transport system permease protein